MSLRQMSGTTPVTENRSKSVMIKAGLNDRLRVENVINHFKTETDVPRELTVIRRSNTYFGPKLELESADESYLITAPGPNTQLLLWEGVTSDGQFISSWDQLAEVEVDFMGDLPQYDICMDCGEPIKSVEHERLAAFGTCPGF